jgi:aerotaxis receptor
MLKDMELSCISGSYTEHQLLYADGSSRKVLVVDEEVPYPEGRLIVSRTDPAGIITQFNSSFIEMSGYTAEELMGAPQHILRHPFMPAVAFKGLWDTVKAGKKWQGYVKNLRKDGRYYWVYATVIPNVRNGQIIGYTSLRRRPSRARIDECIKLYPTLA